MKNNHHYSTILSYPIGFDCSKIHELGIDRQENFRAGAIMVACGEVPGSATSATSTLGTIGYFIKKLLVPLAFGSADVNLVTGTETSPNITQSETFTAVNPDDPNQIFVAYNDSRGRNRQSDQHFRRVDLHRWRDDLHSPHHCGRSKPFCRYRGRSGCSVQQTNRHLVYRVA